MNEDHPMGHDVTGINETTRKASQILQAAENPAHVEAMMKGNKAALVSEGSIEGRVMKDQLQQAVKDLMAQYPELQGVELGMVGTSIDNTSVSLSYKLPDADWGQFVSVPAVRRPGSVDELYFDPQQAVQKLRDVVRS